MQDGVQSHQADAWDRFLQASRPDIGFKQSSWWAEFLAADGWGHFGVILKEAGVILGGARVLTYSFEPRTRFYYVPDGPVLPEGEADAEPVLQAVFEYVERKRREDPLVVSHLQLEPRWEKRPALTRGWREARTWFEPRSTLCVDLNLSEPALLAQMKPKGRYNIGVARRQGVTVVEDASVRGVDDFLAIYTETFARHGLDPKSSRHFHDLGGLLFGSDRGSLLFAEYRGARLATAWMVYFGNRATYLYGGSRLQHRNVMAPYLLHFESMRRAKARGHEWYDFYGIAPENEPDHRWAKFSAFKRKFGGQELRFVPSLDYIYDVDAYEAYRRWRRS